MLDGLGSYFSDGFYVRMVLWCLILVDRGLSCFKELSWLVVEEGFGG